MQLVKSPFAHLGPLERGGTVRVCANAENGPARLGRFDELALNIVHLEITVFHVGSLFFVAAATIAPTYFFGLVFSLLFINIDALRRASQRCSRVGLIAALHLDIQLGSKEPHHLHSALDYPLGKKVANSSIKHETSCQLRKRKHLFEPSPNTALIFTIHPLEISLGIMVGLGADCSFRIANSQQQLAFKEFRLKVCNKLFSGLFVTIIDGQQDTLFATSIVRLQVAFLVQFFFALSSPVLLEALVPGQMRSRDPQKFCRIAESNGFHSSSLAGGWTEGNGRLRPVLGFDHG